MSFEGDLANLANLMEIVENAHGIGVMHSLSVRSSYMMLSLSSYIQVHIGHLSDLHRSINHYHVSVEYLL